MANLKIRSTTCRLNGHSTDHGVTYKTYTTSLPCPTYGICGKTTSQKVMSRSIKLWDYLGIWKHLVVIPSDDIRMMHGTEEFDFVRVNRWMLKWWSMNGIR